MLNLSVAKNPIIVKDEGGDYDFVEETSVVEVEQILQQQNNGNKSRKVQVLSNVNPPADLPIKLLTTLLQQQQQQQQIDLLTRTTNDLTSTMQQLSSFVASWCPIGRDPNFAVIQDVPRYLDGCAISQYYTNE